MFVCFVAQRGGGLSLPPRIFNGMMHMTDDEYEDFIIYMMIMEDDQCEMN